ncbi:glycosyltransferase [Akkermansiaceae bacterium]|nr:glycosyltransferase [Akkermansiaceae bacterium]
MKVLMIHVGNELIKKDPMLTDEHFLTRKMLVGNREGEFLKHDITNADSQMDSLVDFGLEVDYGHLSERKSGLGLLKAGMEIRRRSSQKDVDLVHVLWGSTTGLITCLFSTKPVVVSFCGSDLLGSKGKDGRLTCSGRVNRIISGCVARLANWNITKSNSMAAELPFSAQRKTSVIPNGVNLRGFYPMDREEARTKLGLDLTKKYILFFYSKGQDVKDPDLAKSSFKLIQSRFPNSELVIAKKIPHEELLYYYNSCDLMLLTSFHEGSNNSLKEARACNLPIVSVKVGDAEERLKEVMQCAVIDSREPVDLADASIKILEAEQRSNGADFSGDVVMENIAARVVDVYNKVVEGK